MRYVSRRFQYTTGHIIEDHVRLVEGMGRPDLRDITFYVVAMFSLTVYHNTIFFDDGLAFLFHLLVEFLTGFDRLLNHLRNLFSFTQLLDLRNPRNSEMRILVDEPDEFTRYRCPLLLPARSF